MLCGRSGDTIFQKSDRLVFRGGNSKKVVKEPGEIPLRCHPPAKIVYEMKSNLSSKKSLAGFHRRDADGDRLEFSSLGTLISVRRRAVTPVLYLIQSPAAHACSKSSAILKFLAHTAPFPQKPRGQSPAFYPNKRCPGVLLLIRRFNG